MRKLLMKILSLMMITVICMQLLIVPQKAQAADAEGITGEIRLFAGDFAPYGWALCDGQILTISQNTALFSILGTTYGGDGIKTFALPDLNGRVAIGSGQGPGLSSRVIGETGGESSVSLIESQLPSHSHGSQTLKFDVLNSSGIVKCSTGKGTTPIPGTSTVMSAGLRNEKVYSNDAAAESVNMMPDLVQINAASTITVNTSSAGGSSSHNNMSPYSTLNYIICLYGIYPSRGMYGGDGSGYTGEIKMFAGNFEPNGWIFCDGRSLSIAENVLLFDLIGTNYGGDGQNNFNIPDLRGRAPIGTGQGLSSSTNYILGQTGGTEAETLTVSQIPLHSHTVSQQTRNLKISGNMKASGNSGNSALPGGNAPAVGTRNERIYNTGSDSSMKQGSLSMNLSLSDTSSDVQSSAAGGTQPHNNMKPFNTINYIINPAGIYPDMGGGGQLDFMGSIEMYAFNFVPGDRMQCNGQVLPINQNQAFYSIIGMTYGGNGRDDFALPDMKGRMAIGKGNGYILGQKGGEERHTLTLNEIPSHIHTLSKSITISGSGTLIGTNSPGNSTSPVNSILSRGYKNERIYSTTSNQTVEGIIDVSADIQITPVDSGGNPIASPALALQGGGQPHNNMMPYTSITFAIVSMGYFPNRN